MIEVEEVVAVAKTVPNQKLLNQKLLNQKLARIQLQLAMDMGHAIGGRLYKSFTSLSSLLRRCEE
jgi:hypothetical protein